MTIRTLPLGELGTNCYLISDDQGRTAVIDPAEAAPVLHVAAEAGLQLQAVFLTHGHYDHVGGVPGLMEALHCPVYGSESDLALPPWLRGALKLTDFYAEGDEIAVGELTFRVMQTPGHSTGSVCLACGDVLFSGDTLFAGSYGRTDFPGGDHGAMARSLARLAALPGQRTVYPGHGPATSLDAERPWLPRR